MEWYACRWGLEVWQRILKRGGRIEARQLATGERLQRCLTLYQRHGLAGVCATMLARAVPEMPCRVLLEIEAWQALYGAIHHCPTPPEPSTLARPGRALDGTARWVWGRRRRDQPGAETWWRGFQHLTDFTRMYRIMRSAPP